MEKLDFSAKAVAIAIAWGKPVVTLGYICDRQLKTSDLINRITFIYRSSFGMHHVYVVVRPKRVE